MGEQVNHFVLAILKPTQSVRDEWAGFFIPPLEFLNNVSEL
jgi:hypothetical protein